MSKLTHPYGLDFARAKSLLLWTPNLAGAGTFANIGLPLTQEGTISLQSPGTTIGGYMQRLRFANVGGVADNVAGVRYPTAAHHPFIRASADNVGGFYCSFRWTIGLWPGNETRMFVGLSNDTLNMAKQDHGVSVASDYYGVMHNTVDGPNVLKAVGRNAGTRSESTISGGAGSVTLAAGQSFWLELFHWSNQGTSSIVLWDLNTGLLLYNATWATATSVALGPQIVVSNGSVAGNVAALDAYNIYGFAGD